MKALRIKISSPVLRQAVLAGLACVLLFSLLISLTLAWFVMNRDVETGNTDFYVYYSDIPIYAGIYINAGDDPGEYTDKGYTLQKTLIPGDVINCLIFVKTETVRSGKAELTLFNVPTWLSPFFDRGEFYSVATATDNPDGTVTTDNEAKINIAFENIKHSGNSYSFELTMPDGFEELAGIKLLLPLFFEDTGANQTTFLNATVRVGCSAKEIGR